MTHARWFLGPIIRRSMIGGATLMLCVATAALPAGDDAASPAAQLFDLTAIADADESMLRGDAHLSRGAAALAVSDLEAAIEIHAHHARAHLLLGIALTRIDRHSEARRYFEQALRLEPELYVETHELAVAYARLGNHVRARAILDRILQTHPDDVDALYLDGRLAVRTDDFAAGMATLARVMELDPAHADAATEIALAHLRDGDARAALTALQRANALLINQRAVMHGMVRAYEMLGSDGEAATYATRCEALREAWEGIDREQERIRRNPRDAAAYERTGRHLVRLRHFDAATGMLQTAILLDPEQVEARKLLGTAYSGLQMFGEAEAVLHTALALSPDDPAIHRELATCYRFSGSFKLAERHHKQALALKARADSLEAAAGGTGEDR